MNGFLRIWRNVCKTRHSTFPCREAKNSSPFFHRHFCDFTEKGKYVEICGEKYKTDDWTNITDKVISYIGVNLHLQQNHPLELLKRKVIKFMHSRYVNSRGNPLFSVHDRLSPVVTTVQNFDRILVPKDHPSRRKTDSYYVNEGLVLRAHTSAHQYDLVRSGLDNFLVVGDVYRRDDIDATHFPVFHQAEGVRVCTQHQVSRMAHKDIHLFREGKRCDSLQETHTVEACRVLEADLKSCIEALAKCLFGQDVKCRWVETHFPFTHPSWELEVLFGDRWVEMLGCGIMEQKLLQSAGAGDKIGWAFGLGLERLAMRMYQIPDIRLFWSKDTGFLSQFQVADESVPVVYKPISVFPQCVNDISFWVPDQYCSADFYDLVRSVGGDLVEQVTLVDEFYHPKKAKSSHCYRIVYRHLEKTLTQEEVNVVHRYIESEASKKLGVIIR